VVAVALSGDGKELVASYDDGAVRWWDVPAGTLLMRRLSVRTLVDRRLALSPEGFRLAGLAKSVLVLQDRRLPKGGRVFPVPAGARELAVAPDGRSVAVVFDKGVRIYEVATGAMRTELAGAHPAGGCVAAFSPDGRLVVTGGAERTICSWDLAGGTPLFRLAQPSAPAGLAWSPDGTGLAACGEDTTVVLWDAAKLRRRNPPLLMTLTDGMLPGLWADLGGRDASKAYLAMRRLWSAAPGRAEAVLRARLGGPSAADMAKARELLRELDSDSFAERERAEGALLKMGMRAAPALAEALEGEVSAEVRNRARGLLARVKKSPPEAATATTALAEGRAAEVLERLDTTEGRALLRAWAAGPPEGALAKEATSSLGRLGKARHRPKP
jgi:hypothetical protein